MKNRGSFLFIIILGVLVTLAVFWTVSSSQAFARPDQAASSSTTTPQAPLTDEGENSASFQADTTDEQMPPRLPDQGSSQLLALPTQVPGETTVYFVPSDSDDTATVIYLYNTDEVNHTVALRGFRHNGVQVFTANINIGATSFLRLVSDSVAPSPPYSWATPAPILTSFTDSTFFASLSLPRGVKVEGYTLFNPDTGTIDPRADQGAIPLRFSSDPATVYLPAAVR